MTRTIAMDAASPGLFGDTSEPHQVVAPAPLSQRGHRRKQSKRLREGKTQRWIDAGIPVALAVARANGKVTAATFRAEAELRKGVLPPKYGEDRTLSYITSIFAALVRSGHLRKERHQNGKAVTAYDPKTGNEHVVYVLTARAG